jgi:hypothetical protein
MEFGKHALLKQEWILILKSSSLFVRKNKNKLKERKGK